MPDPQTTLTPTTEYLRACYEHDKQFASEANLRAVQVSVDIGKEKTQYFEKIALVAGMCGSGPQCRWAFRTGRSSSACGWRSGLQACSLDMCASSDSIQPLSSSSANTNYCWGLALGCFCCESLTGA